MDAILYATGCDARTFNSNLKRYFKEVLGIKVRVRIVNSYNFPDCYAQVGLVDRSNEMPYMVRKYVALEVYPHLKADDKFVLGNIGLTYISVKVKQWEAAISKYEDFKLVN